MSQYENDSLKGGAGSNAGDIPLWRQNQIQKKRVREQISCSTFV